MLRSSWRRAQLLSVPVLVAVSCAGFAQPQWRLDAIDVVTSAPATTSPSSEHSDEALRRVPGGTTLIDSERLREGRTTNLEESLSSAPGVFARSRFGQDESRVSIRGSGLGQNFNTQGVRLLRDGLPVTEADGNTRSQLINPATADHMTLHRGANAMTRGAATLGGAIDLRSRTGRTDAGISSRAETGSFGYNQFRVNGGHGSSEHMDGWFSLGASQEDGYRKQSAQSRSDFYGNLGWQHSEGAETRVHLDLQRHRLELPGSLNREQYLDDERQANPDNAEVGAARDLDLARFSAQHAMELSERSRLHFGGFAQSLSMDHPLAFATIDSRQQDLGLSLRHELTATLAGRDNRFIWGAMGVAGTENDTQEFNNFPGEQERDFRAGTAELFADNQWHWSDELAITLSAQAMLARREVDEVDGPRNHRTYQGFSPRLGALYEPVAGLQFFANASRAVEPPTNGQLLDDNDELVRDQRSHSVEVGSRGELQDTNWELVLYRANVKRQILLFSDPEQPEDSVTTNADRTRLQGMEAAIGLRVDLTETAHIKFNATWNWNHLRFRDDGQWGNNQLPGVPEHEVRVMPSYRHSSGFHGGPVLDYRNGTPVDFANSQRTATTVLWGLKGGYDSPRGWSLTLEGRNLGDRRHVNTVDVVADATQPGQDQVLNPGNGRAVYGGVEWQW